MALWLGLSFPKSLDISKAIDKAAGAEREVIGRYIVPADSDAGNAGKVIRSVGAAGGFGGNITADRDGTAITAPATDVAKQWSGWGTALKPAWEPIILARKPLSEKNVAANVLKHGTGGLNIDGSRIGNETIEVGLSLAHRGGKYGAGTGGRGTNEVSTHQGRWPANVLLSHADGCELIGVKKVKSTSVDGKDVIVRRSGVHAEAKGHQTVGREQPSVKGYADADGKETVEDWRCIEDCPVRLLDKQSGKLPAGRFSAKSKRGLGYMGAEVSEDSGPARSTGDSGGASRFFYCAKASRSERGEGNNHPTVKPIALMRYLIRLVTPPGGLLLDPFCGSGTTLVAAAREGVDAIGIDKTPEYVTTARKRLE